MQIAIIGMGPAGVSVVKTLRENGCDDPVTLFSAEKVPPYSPPALGDYLITGRQETLFWQGRNFCDKYSVTCRSGERIIQIFPQENKILTDKNKIFGYDRLVIASGSSLYAPVKGSDKKGILNFKTLDGADRIKHMAMQEGKSAIIVGGGFIGVEIALCLAKIGIRPAVLNRRGWIMPRLLDTETAAYVEKDLRTRGVDVMLNTEAVAFFGDEQVKGLVTAHGKELTADIYIAATGVRPNIDFIRDTDIEHKDGIIVNKYLQTRYPDIYACGDVAETIDFISGERKIHGLYPVAVDHGRTVAWNLMGKRLAYGPQISLNSLKELGFKIMVAGRPDGEQLKYRTSDTLRKLYITDGRITGFVLLGDISNAGVYLSLMYKKTDVSGMKTELVLPGFTMARFAAGQPFRISGKL